MADCSTAIKSLSWSVPTLSGERACRCRSTQDRVSYAWCRSPDDVSALEGPRRLRAPVGLGRRAPVHLRRGSGPPPAAARTRAARPRQRGHGNLRLATILESTLDAREDTTGWLAGSLVSSDSACGHDLGALAGPGIGWPRTKPSPPAAPACPARISGFSGLLPDAVCGHDIPVTRSTGLARARNRPVPLACSARAGAGS